MKTNNTKFIEDLVKEENIDILALSKAKFRNPVRHWINMKWLNVKDMVEEMVWRAFNFIR